MLLPLILRMFDQNHAQQKPAEQPRAAEQVPKSQEASGLKSIELEIAAAAELAKAPAAAPTSVSSAGPFLEELLRAINKFEKTDQSRVVDVFE